MDFKDTNRINVNQAMRARLFLKRNAIKRKTINKKYSSYRLKHLCEAWLESKGNDTYISNESFCFAANEMGFESKQTFEGSPNYFFNLKFDPRVMATCNRA
jgi:hypothetical protein